MKKLLSLILIIFTLVFYTPTVWAKENSLEDNNLISDVVNDTSNENINEGENEEEFVADLSGVDNNTLNVENNSVDTNNDNDENNVSENTAVTNTVSNEETSPVDNVDNVVTTTTTNESSNNEVSDSTEPLREESSGSTNHYNIKFYTDDKSYYVEDGTDVTLSTLITKLELGIDIANVTSVISSDSNYLQVTNIDNDFKFTVTDEFESVDTVKTLTINLVGGITKIVNVKTVFVPDHEKDKIDNGDGTYNLFLSVTGDVDKEVTGANIVVVFDTSGSMRDKTYTTTTGNSGTQYGYVDDSFVSIYRGYDGNWYVTSTNKRYNGVRYVETDTTRLQAAKNAVNNLANGLLGINTNENPDLVYMALVDFANYAVIAQSATTSYSTFEASVNRLSAEGSRGTNWEDALYFANLVTFPKDYKIYVIFVSDGEPTYRNTREQTSGTENASHTYGTHTVYGSGNSDNNGLNYKYALQNAKAIVDAGKEFYTIGVFTNVNKMRTITTDAGAPISNYYTAMASDELEAALDEIMGKIKNAGIGAVTVSDGTTSNVTTTTNEIAELLEVDETSYKYYLEFDVEPVAQNADGFTHKFDKYNLIIETISGNNVNITIKYYKGNDLQTATYTGTLEGNHLKINWDRATSFVDANPTAENSTVSARLVNGAVEWSLVDLQTLLNSVTYKVEFTVWPSQYTLDLIADLKNGDKIYSELDPNIQMYLIKDGDNYTLLTNTTATITFTDSRTDDGLMSSTYDNPDPVATATAEMITVAKEWENGIDERDAEPISLYVTRDGEIASTITLPTTGNAWSDSRHISVGIMTRDGNSIDLKTTGHDYTITEEESMSYYWEIDVPTVHPMNVNNVLTVLYKLKDSEVPEAMIAMLEDYQNTDGFYYTDGTKEYYYLTGYGYYIVGGETESLLTATNNRRSVLDIQKELTGTDANMDQLFDFEVTVTTPDDDDVWFSIAIVDEPISIFYHDPVSDTDVDLVSGALANTNSQNENGVRAQIRTSWANDPKFELISLDRENKIMVYKYDGKEATVDFIEETSKIVDGEVVVGYTYYTRYYYAPTGTTLHIKLKDGWNLRFINLLTGTEFTVKELDNTLAEGYVFNSNSGERTYKEKNENGEYEDKTENLTDSNINDTIFACTIEKYNSIYTIIYNNEYVITHVDVTKTWEDESNTYENRPDSITFILTGTTTSGYSKTYTHSNVTGTGNTWTDTFSNLPVYYVNNGVKELINYALSELSVTGYSVSQNGYSVTNTLNTTSLSGTKTWEDENNKYGNRPDSITVVVQGKDSEGNVLITKEIVVDAVQGNTWNYSIDNLPTYVNKKAVTYSVTEITVNGYTVVVSGSNLTNTTDLTSLTITKTWDDGSNANHNRPNTITVIFEGKDTEGNVLITKEYELGNKTGDVWEFVINDLPKYVNSLPVTYSIKEKEVVGYSTEINGFSITNTEGKTSVSGTKTWEDENNKYGNRPDTITIVLVGTTTAGYSKEYSQEIRGNGNTWDYSFTGLPIYDNNNVITYAVSELSVNGYTVVPNGTNLTNTTATTSLSGTKTWEDENNKYGNRPDSITVVVQGKDSEGNVLITKEIVVDAVQGNTWNYSIDNLPTYVNKKAVTYSVTEITVNGYTVVASGSNLTNTTATTSYSGQKVWEENGVTANNRPNSIIVELYANDEFFSSKEVTSEDNWAFTFDNLPEYIGKEKAVYSVKEVAVNGYTSSVSGNTITNTRITISIDGTKSWNEQGINVSNLPESITIILLANGKEYARTEVTGNNNWSYVFNNLPTYIGQKEVTYTIDELEVLGYTTNVSDYNVTNTRNVIKSISGTKTWVDNDDQDGIRPNEVTIILLANGEEYARTTAAKDNNWTYEFTNLPTHIGQKEVTYTIKEIEVTGYTSKVDGYNVTNTHQIETISIDINKVWDDEDDVDETRPESIEVILLADGEEVNKVTLSESNNWKYTFTDLDKNASGKEIVYTIKEVEVDEYESTISGDAKSGFTITNYHEPYGEGGDEELPPQTGFETIEFYSLIGEQVVFILLLAYVITFKRKYVNNN